MTKSPMAHTSVHGQVKMRWAWQLPFDAQEARALAVMRTYMWAGSFAVMVLAKAIFLFAGVALEVKGLFELGGALIAFSAIKYYIVKRMHAESLAVVIDAVVAVILFTTVFSILSYAITWVTAFMPLQDSMLAALDRAVGLNWPNYFRAVLTSPWSSAFYHAYASIPHQLALVLVMTALFGQAGRCMTFLIAAMISLIVCALVMAVLPAIGAMHYYGLVPQDIAPGVPFPTGWLKDYMAMRSQAITVLRLEQLNGIVTFPSFHTVIAILFMWVMWPIRWVRWPVVMWNVLMLAATPVFGEHHFADLGAGAAVAAFSLAMAGLLWRRAYNSASEIAMAASAAASPAMPTPVRPVSPL